MVISQNSFCKLLCWSALLIPLAGWAAKGDLPARTQGFYLGLGGGLSVLDLDSGGLNISGTDFGWKGLLGYRLPGASLPWGMNVALQGAYVDLGDVYDQAGGSDFNYDLNGWDFAAVGYFPMTRRWELMTKVGVYAWDTKINRDGVRLGNYHGTDWSFGLGGAWETGTPWALQAEVEYFDVYDGAWLFSVSGIYQFK